MAQVNVIKDLEQLSLSFIHKLSTKGLQYISNLRNKLLTRSILSSCTALVVLLLNIIIYLVRRRLNIRCQAEPAESLKLSFQKDEDGLHLSEGGFNLYARTEGPSQERSHAQIKRSVGTAASDHGLRGKGLSYFKLVHMRLLTSIDDA